MFYKLHTGLQAATKSVEQSIAKATVGKSTEDESQVCKISGEGEQLHVEMIKKGRKQ